jgi:hypothetical protein
LPYFGLFFNASSPRISGVAFLPEMFHDCGAEVVALVEVTRKACRMPLHGVQRQPDERDVPFAVLGLE